tara:strand:+ start:68 stop:481 length:414 start_codon:yes stop_codon:yes gene_type:complete
MIEINNLSKTFVNKKYLRQIEEKVLKGEKKNVNVSLVLVDEREIQKLNRKYRKKNKATDVLSFGISKDIPKVSGNKKEIGEIVICPQVVKGNAKKYNIVYNKELARVLTHGILHLLGYTHQQENQARKMRKKEQSYG